MARKTKEEAQETRNRILNAAIDVFYTEGVARSTLEGIAEAAGVTRGAVYWHFKNKSDLFSAIHQQFHVSIMEGLSTKESEPENPLDHLMEFSVNFLDLILRDEWNSKVFSLFTLKCDYSGEMSPFLEEQRAKKTQSVLEVEKLFELAKAKGQIGPDKDAHLLAVSFFCYICGISTEFFRNPDLVSLEKNARPLIAQFFRTL